MATNFPSSLDTSTQQPTIAASDEMDDSGKEHDVVHTNHSGAIIALETKLGSTDSDPADGKTLMGTGTGTSEWTTITPTIVETFASQSISASGTTVTFTSSRFASAPNVMVTQANSGGGGSKVPNVDNISASSCRVFLLNTSGSFVAGDASLLVTLEV